MLVAPLPRPVQKWLDTLDLSYSVKNVKRDIANGFIVAEILTRHYPREVNIYSFHNGLNTEKKIDNWKQISTILKKKEFSLDESEYDLIINYAPDSAFTFFVRLYEFLTEKKLPSVSKLTMSQKIQKEELSVPGYIQPTASLISKNRHVQRIVDQNKQKSTITQNITQHLQKVREEKQKSNIIEYLVMKRNREVEEELRRQQLETSMKHKQFLDQTAPEIKEIQIKSFEKDNKKKETEVIDGRETLDVLTKICEQVMSKKEISDELDLIKIDDRINKVQFILQNCNEFTKKTLKQIIIVLQENVNQIIDCITNSHGEYNFFLQIVLKTIEDVNPTIKAFNHLIELLKSLGEQLVQVDGPANQLLFETICLEKLVNIVKKYPIKRSRIIGIFYSFCQQNSVAHLRVVKRIKSILGRDLKTFVLIAANLVTINQEIEMDEVQINNERNDHLYYTIAYYFYYNKNNTINSNQQELFNLFLYYSMMAIDFSSAITRANGLKILNEISHINYQPIVGLIKKLKNLASDEWWEVQAQILIICSNLLIYISHEDPENMVQEDSHNQSEMGVKQQEIISNTIQETSLENTMGNEENNRNNSRAQIIQELKDAKIQNERQLLEIIDQIFVVESSENILRVGLIYLSPVLNHYPQLCDRFLEIQLSIQNQIRETTLIINPLPGTEVGQLVKGCFTFQYKLTGVPLLWNSIGIASSLDQFVIKRNLENFEKEHLEILQGCLVNPIEQQDCSVWFEIYDHLRNHIFLSFCDRDLCNIASNILKKLFLLDQIQDQLLKSSSKIFLKVLSLIEHDDTDQICKENILEFFEYLNNEGGQIFQTYLYEIIKEFSEKKRNAFLKSNLVQFMNNLSKQRRSKYHIQIKELE